MRNVKNSHKMAFKFQGFNENLINVNYSERTKLLTIQFKNIAAGSTKIDCFEMGLRCDLNFFEEFWDSCITDCKSSKINDTEFINKSIETFITLRRICQRHELLNFCLRLDQTVRAEITQAARNLKGNLSLLTNGFPYMNAYLTTSGPNKKLVSVN